MTRKLITESRQLGGRFMQTKKYFATTPRARAPPSLHPPHVSDTSATCRCAFPLPSSAEAVFRGRFTESIHDAARAPPSLQTAPSSFPPSSLHHLIISLLVSVQLDDARVCAARAACARTQRARVGRAPPPPQTSLSPSSLPLFLSLFGIRHGGWLF